MKGPWLYLAAVSAIAIMAASAAAGQRTAVAIAAQVFAMIAIAAALALNLPLWRAVVASSDQTLPAVALARTTRVTALVYGWAGLALFAIYLLTPLKWQHGWQYASVMSLISIGNAVYAKRLLAATAGEGLASRRSVDRVVQLAALQGVAIFGALFWMLASGKLDTQKADWAANDIFISGGLALIAISAIVVKTHAALTSQTAKSDQ